MPRVSLDGRVDLLVDDHGRAGQVRNLSTGGIFVEEIEPRPELDAKVDLAFSLPGGAFVEGQAKVVRTVAPGDGAERSGVALRFERLFGAGKQRIKDFIGEQTEPLEGVPVRIRIGEQVMRVESGPASGDVLQLDCALPFLKLGAPVDLLPGGGEQHDTRGGALRWVSIHVPPGSTTPRIRLGVELSRADALGAIEPIVPTRKDPTGVEVISTYLDDEPVVVAGGPHTRISNDRTMMVTTSKQRAIAARRRLSTHLMAAVAAAAVTIAAGAWLLRNPTPPLKPPAAARPAALPKAPPTSEPAAAAASVVPASVVPASVVPASVVPASVVPASAAPRVAVERKAEAQPTKDKTRASAKKAGTNQRASVRARRPRRRRRISKKRRLIRGHLRRARRALERRDFSGAHRHADRAMRLDPGNPEAAAVLSSAISRQI